MNHDYMREIRAYYSRKKNAKKSCLDEFLNIKDDDKVEEEEGAARVRDEAMAREGEGVGVREADVTCIRVTGGLLDQFLQ